MKSHMFRIAAVTILSIVCSSIIHAQEINPSEVKESMQKVADWQIEHINDLYSGHVEPHHPLA